MRSIRLSLIVYFLVLLALALGAVSALAYWNASSIIESRKATTKALLCEQHDRRCNREHRKLDSALLYQARTLASLAQFQLQGNGMPLPVLAPLGILTAGPSPYGFLQVPVWLAEGTRGPLASRVYRMYAGEIQFNEVDLPVYPDGPLNEYFQITSEWGNTWRSQSLEDHLFPINPDQFATIKLFDWTYDSFEIKPGVKVRRVTLKAQASRIRFRNMGGPPIWRINPSAPILLVQCAAETNLRDAEFAKFDAEHKRELAELDEESTATLHRLAKQLLAIGFATFTLTVVGGFALIWVGLLPLRRLSEAVSRVSEKDFRLQINERRLPVELRPIADRISQTLEQLQLAFEREKQATADISHELRTPLAALLTTTEVALRKPRSAEEYRQLLGDCRSIGQQLSQQVERLLALARLDAGVDRVRAAEVDAALMAEQCVALVRPLAEARNLKLGMHSSGDARLHTDPDKLREVLTNLLHNAIEYNQPDGSVDVSVERQNGELKLEVRDTGIGIAPEARSQIFQRFFRADISRHGAGLHAGLGLAIVKGYLDLMGGQISVESALGQGSTFCVRLPAKHAANETYRIAN